ncbi:MAG: hypothetical protein ACK4VY_00620 [Brevundimonas sp.]
MPRALAAATAYFAIVFCLAFLLGVARTLVVAPATGEVVAVLIEAPIVLLISGFAAVWGARRFAVPPTTPARLTMGFVAFVLLMAVESGMSLLLFDRTLSLQWAAFATPAGAIGLLAQIAFAFIPLLVARRR